MMITVNRIEDEITGSYKGIPFGVTYDEQKFAQMKDLEKKAGAATSMDELNDILSDFELLTHEDYKDLVEHTKGGQYLWVSRKDGKVYLQINGMASKHPIPAALVQRIITSVEKKIDVMPLVKCWTRFLRNPNYTDAKASRFANYINNTVLNQSYMTELMDKKGLSREVAQKKATTFDVSITQEGLLTTFKVSREITHRFVKDESAEGGVKKIDRDDYDVDEVTGLKTYKKPETVEERLFEPAVKGQTGDAFFCGEKEGHVIRVGKYHHLKAWDMVDCNDSQSCVKGLHVGGQTYIRGYQDDNTVTHQVFVDPMHIGAITDDGSGALRVLGYFVYGSFAGVTGGIYHSSEYAKVTDAEYAAMVEEAVKLNAQRVDDATQDLKHSQNLASL